MRCIFCSIIRGQMAAEFLYQDETVVAIRDINPQAPVHLLVLPRRHIPTLLDLEQEDEELLGHICSVATKLAIDHGVSRMGFRLVVNCGAEAGQSVYHIHFHLMGGRSMQWPPG